MLHAVAHGGGRGRHLAYCQLLLHPLQVGRCTETAASRRAASASAAMRRRVAVAVDSRRCVPRHPHSCMHCRAGQRPLIRVSALWAPCLPACLSGCLVARRRQPPVLISAEGGCGLDPILHAANASSSQQLSALLHGRGASSKVRWGWEENRRGWGGVGCEAGRARLQRSSSGAGVRQRGGSTWDAAGSFVASPPPTHTHTSVGSCMKPVEPGTWERLPHRCLWLAPLASSAQLLTPKRCCCCASWQHAT